MMAGELDRLEVETRYARPDGRLLWVRLSISPVRFDGERPSFFVDQIDDITETRMAQDRLAESKAVFAAAFDNAPIGMALTSLDANLPGRFLQVNRSLCQMLGYSEEELRGLSFPDITHPDDVEADLAALERLRAGVGGLYETEKRYRHRDGRWVWVHLRAALVRAADNEPAQVVSQMVDITDQRRAAQQLSDLAFHDSLTGLANRRLFMDRLSQVLQSAGPADTAVGVLFLDMDRFKRINDSMGHECGDDVLVEMAARLRRAMRPGNSVARFGGDEFVVLLEGITEPAGALAVADRLRESVRQPCLDGRVVVTASVGVGLGHPGATAEGLIADADTAMYHAKQHGADRCMVFGETMRSRAVQRMDAETRLRAALHAGRLVALYQPMIDLKRGSLVGAEALLRYRDGDQLLSPAGFLAVAEESNLIVDVGRWMLAQAVNALTSWSARPGAHAWQIAVNVSPRQLASDTLIDDLKGVLAAGLRPGRILVEITESALIDADDDAIVKIEQLKGLGVRVALDDFGTGYSSLNHLRRFPIDVVKIDRSFIAGLGTSSEDSAIVTGMVNLCRALGITTVAEGVETPEQLRLVTELGCDVAQGYLLGLPGPPDRIAARTSPLSAA